MLTATAQQHQAQALMGEDESYMAGGGQGAEGLDLLYSATDAGEHDGHASELDDRQLPTH